MDYTVHPSETLKEVLAYTKVSVDQASIDLEVTKKELVALLNGHRRITEELAFKLYNVFGISDIFWLNMQSSYDKFISKNRG